MFIRRLALPAVLAASGLMVLGVVSAEATTALRTDPGGALLSVSTTLTNTTSSNAVLNTSLGTVTCARTTLLGRANANTSATSISGTGQLTFSSCTDTIAPMNITSCKGYGNPPSLSATAIAGGGHVTIGSAIGRCSIQNSTSACYYATSSTTGTASNAAGSISFPSVLASTVQPATDALASGLCGSASTFSVTLFHGVSQAGQTLTITTS